MHFWPCLRISELVPWFKSRTSTEPALQQAFSRDVSAEQPSASSKHGLQLARTERQSSAAMSSTARVRGNSSPTPLALGFITICIFQNCTTEPGPGFLESLAPSLTLPSYPSRLSIHHLPSCPCGARPSHYHHPRTTQPAFAVHLSGRRSPYQHQLHNSPANLLISYLLPSTLKHPDSSLFHPDFFQLGFLRLEADAEMQGRS